MRLSRNPLTDVRGSDGVAVFGRVLGLADSLAHQAADIHLDERQRAACAAGGQARFCEMPPSGLDPRGVRINAAGRCIVAKTSQTPVPADLNADGLITPADYGLWSDCIAGPEIPLLADCGLADLDADGDTDLADFALFARAMTP